MSKLETSIYIVGPKKNWELSRTHLLAIVGVLGGIFLTLVGFSTYLYLMGQYQTEKLQQRYQEEKLKTEKLQENFNRLEHEFEEKLTQLRQQLQERPEPENQPVPQTASGVQLRLKEKDTFIKDLQEQQQQLILENQQLKDKVQFADDQNLPDSPIQLSASISPISMLSSPGSEEVTVEQFRYGFSEPNQMKVQLHLKNLTDVIQSGFVRILPVYKSQLVTDIPFKRYQVTSFSIRRFRSFEKEITNNTDKPYTSVRVTVWGKNQEKLLDQYYPLENPRN
ncbi:hypothetical protein WDW89_18755 [Deltaproteobacteria bacterium TL4]